MLSNEPNKPGRPGIVSRQGLYAKTSKFAFESIDTLVDLMRNSPNDSIKLGAAKVILSKCLPDLKAVAIKEETSSVFTVKLLSGYYSPGGWRNPASVGTP